jgi:hypothetical protein
MGWYERVPRSALDAFEARVQAEDTLPQYRVFDRRDDGAAVQPSGDEVYAT